MKLVKLSIAVIAILMILMISLEAKDSFKKGLPESERYNNHVRKGSVTL